MSTVHDVSHSVMHHARRGLQKGTVCPPTKVEVIRPENGVVWNPECWGAQLDNAIDTHDAGAFSSSRAEELID
eukprot:4676949-Amphidinium_carterae.1